MQDGQPSSTASQAALLRAAHPILDAPCVFADPLAGALCGLTDERSVREALEALTGRLEQHGGLEVARAWLTAARATVAVRARWAEDQLRAAVETYGVRQYVILGAGLDSFAYREPAPGAPLSIFEVDHPASQAAKRARLATLGLTARQKLSFVPVDLEREALIPALTAGGFEVRQPAFFAALGLVLYLSPDALRRQLTAIAGGAPGTQLALNYLVPPHRLEQEADRAVWQVLDRFTRHQGEPSRSCFEPQGIAALLTGCGFKHLEDLPAQAITARYLSARGDGLTISPLTHRSWRQSERAVPGSLCAQAAPKTCRIKL